MLGGGEEGQDARDGRHWRARALAPASSRFLWALPLSGPLCLVGSLSLPLPVFSVSVSLSGSFCLCILPPWPSPSPFSFLVCLSPCSSFCFCLSFALSASLFPSISAFFLPPLCPGTPLTWEEIRHLGRRGTQVGRSANRPGGGESRAGDKRPRQRAREEVARSEPRDLWELERRGGSEKGCKGGSWGSRLQAPRWGEGPAVGNTPRRKRRKGPSASTARGSFSLTRRTDGDGWTDGRGQEVGC